MFNYHHEISYSYTPFYSPIRCRFQWWIRRCMRLCRNICYCRNSSLNWRLLVWSFGNFQFLVQLDGLVQDYSIPIANGLEKLHSSTKQSKWYHLNNFHGNTSSTSYALWDAVSGKACVPGIAIDNIYVSPVSSAKNNFVEPVGKVTSPCIIYEIIFVLSLVDMKLIQWIIKW